MANWYQAAGKVKCPQNPQIACAFGLSLMCMGALVLQAGCQGGNSSGREAHVRTPSQDGTDNGRDEVSGDVPRIVVDSNVCDLGDVGAGMTKPGKFTFKNAGTAPLKILQVKSCCGVQTKGVKKGQVYAPGRSGALRFTCSVRMRLGPARWRLYLKTNDPNESVVQLTIKAKVVQRIVFEPNHLKFFKEMPNAGVKDIKLTSADGKPFAITDFRSTLDIVTADFDPSKEATEFILKPKVDVEKLPRNRKGQVSIDLTHPECKNIRINFDVLSEFTLSSYQIPIFRIKPGQARKWKLSVFNNYGAEFDIESVTMKTKGIVHLDQQVKEGNCCELTLSFVPPEIEEGQTVFADDLEVKIRGGETLTAKVRLFYE